MAEDPDFSERMRLLVSSIQPVDGSVVPIRSIQETRTPVGFEDAYVAQVNVKAASKVTKVLDSALSRKASPALQHLRRFAKYAELPQSLKDIVDVHNQSAPAMDPSLFVLIGPPKHDIETLRPLLTPFMPILRTKSHSNPDSPTEKSPEPEAAAAEHPGLLIFTARVPVHPPSDAETAQRWSTNFWPSNYNPAALRATQAAPRQVLNKAQKSIEPRAGYYLSLAREVAKEAKDTGRGRSIGAVIVDTAIEKKIDENAWEQGYNSRERWMSAVVAVAGDARFARSEAGQPSYASTHPDPATNPAHHSYQPDIEAGPDLHALMRAVELVAHQRRKDPQHEAQMAGLDFLPIVHTDPQLAEQLSPYERYFLFEAGSYVFHDGFTSPSPSISTSSSMSPRKRKLEEPNMESISVSLDAVLNAESSRVPLPAPPPSDPTAPDDQEASDDAAGANQRIRTRAQGGYLCTSLDIYLTHEPCVCCSMGLLLSRFRSVIFPRSARMTTGGIASEPLFVPKMVVDENGDERIDETSYDRQYYGLHWRQELNWRCLGFEFLEDEPGEIAADGIEFHA